jgi:hypothetical protein
MVVSVVVLPWRAVPPEMSRDVESTNAEDNEQTLIRKANAILQERRNILSTRNVNDISVRRINQGTEKCRGDEGEKKGVAH